MADNLRQNPDTAAFSEVTIVGEAKTVAESERGEALLALLSDEERETVFAKATQAFLERSPSFRKDLHGAIAQGKIRADVLERLTETTSSPQTV